MAASSTYTFLGENFTPGKTGPTQGEHKIAWVDGATAGTIPDCVVPATDIAGGMIAAIGVLVGAVTPPNTITVTIKDYHGIPILVGTIATTGRIDVSTPVTGLPVLYRGQLTVSHSGNTTANATGETYILVA